MTILEIGLGTTIRNYSILSLFAGYRGNVDLGVTSKSNVTAY